MIKKLLILIFISSFLIFAQNDKKQNPGVELPDFVITGRDVVSIQKSNKKEPDFISTVSEDFFKPVYPADDLKIKDFSNPIKKDLNLFDTTNFYNGLLEFGIGNNNLPRAKIAYGVPFQNGIFQAYFKGNNQTDYQADNIENSSKNDFEGGGNLSFFIDNDAAAFPGTQFNFHGDYGSSNFKFFGSQTPELKRSINTGNAYFNLKNLLSSKFIIDGKISDQYTSMPNESFSEHLLRLNGYAQVNFGSFNLGVAADLKNQSLNLKRTANASNLNKNKDEFLGIKPVVGINISDLFKIKLGFNYSASGSENYFAPYASAGFKLNNNLSFFGEFNPHAEFYSNGDFLRQNRYYNPPNSPNVFTRKKNFIKAVLKYEYEKYFEIDGGASYYAATDFPYFISAQQSGKFDITTVDVEDYELFINLLFHLGPFGEFYGSAKYNIMERDDNGNAIPYYPKMRASLFYSYHLANNLTGKASLKFYSKRYTDAANTISLGSYFDLGLKFDYELIKQFHLTLEFANLTGNTNYIWAGYEELPLSVIGGFIFRW